MKKFKIFIIGSAKTGTTSVQHAVSQLGYIFAPTFWRGKNKGYIYINEFSNHEYNKLFSVVEKYDAVKDRPWNQTNFYQLLDKRFPDSKFILTIRDTEAWLSSYGRWEKKIDLRNLPFYKTVSLKSYGVKDFLSYPQLMKQKYEERNKEVIDYFKNTNKLLIMDLEKGDGWEKLCLFLEENIIEGPFIHANRTK